MGSNADWYARKLRGEPTPQAAVNAVLPPMPPPAPVVPAQFRPVIPSPAPLPPSGCPSCGSGNYGKPSPTMAARCFDCGYGLAIQNSTQGLPAPNTGVATPAVQVPTAGYNPGQIIGKVE